MRSLLATTAATALLALVTALPATAHVGVMPGDIAPGTTLDARIVLAHGCGPDGTVPGSDADASPTEAVTVEVPDGLGLTAREVDGWELTTTTDATGRTVEARWEAQAPAGVTGSVFLDVTLDAAGLADGTDLWLPVVQSCVDGERMLWTLPDGEERDGRLAATWVSVSDAAPNAPAPTGTSPILAGLLIAGLTAAAGTASYVVTGRRR
jgi:uncharacterized protein YcnI